MTMYGGGTFTNTVAKQAQELREMYHARDGYITDMRQLLELEDSDDNPFDLERFTSNDPRTLWNMGTFLLQPRPLVNNVSDVDGSELIGDTRVAAETLEQFLNRQWRDLNENYMRRGRAGLYWEIIGNMTASGWYSVPYLISPKSLIMGFWNPTTVYPEWSDDVMIGLVRLARIRKISSSEARRLAIEMGWNWSFSRPNTEVTEFRLWIKRDGVISYGVSFNNDLVRPLSVVAGLRDIPVMVGGVGSTPPLDSEGTLFFNKGRAMIGASIMDTNREIYKQYNRQSSFLQQLLHDTANPKTVERTSRGDSPIVKDESEFYRRGAHFRLGPDDELGALDLPSIPPEGTQLTLMLRNMIQRGGFSDATFGNIAGQVTALVITQAAEAAQQITAPYHQAMEYICTQISRWWVDEIMKRPDRYGFLSPNEVIAIKHLRDEEVNFTIRSSYSVQVPGDTAARIVMAKQAAPNFAVSAETAMRMFMPEVTDPKLELSRVRAERAEEHPVFETARVVNAMQEAANALRGRNENLAQILEQSAQGLLQQLSGKPAQPDPQSILAGEQNPQAGGAGVGPNMMAPGLSDVFSGGSSGPANNAPG